MSAVGRLLALLMALVLAGCATVAPLPLPAAADKRIALTFDDIPRDRGAWLDDDERARWIVAGLRRADVSTLR